MKQGDREFRPRLGRVRTRAIGAKRGKGFVAQVLAAAERSGAGLGGARSQSAKSSFGRGRVASWRAERMLSDRSRRVVVKARVVRQGPRIAPMRAHLSYLKRDGVTRDGSKAQMFDATTEEADTVGFAQRTEGDRHHFRFTVSPEDAERMTDLRAFTRDLMAQMQDDLGTKLDWVAIDHWNTDNPHIHVVLRGKAEDGADLVISRDYISRGLRARAADFVTIELGPQSEIEIHRKLAAEIEAERWTRLDGAIQRLAQANEAGIVDLRPAPDGAGGNPLRGLLVGRLQRLERMGLAGAIGSAQWILAEAAEPTLRDLGIRGDIVKTMHRALTGAGHARSPAEFAIHDPGSGAPTLTGRVVERGLHDELAGTGYLILDGIDGRAHYLRVASLVELEEIATGSVVATGPARARPSDRMIADLARDNDGIYAPDHHRRLLREAGGVADPDAIVEAHVRRLEAMRRAGIVARLPDGRWEVPADYLDRARTQDLKRGTVNEQEIRVLADLPVERQVTAHGATWLDRELLAPEKTELTRSGFGQTVRDALDRRATHLAEQGLARRQGPRLLFARDLLDTLTERELADAAQRIAGETGLEHRRLGDGDRLRGTYRRRVDLVSGRFALIDDGKQFVLVPWRPIVESELGKEVTGIVRSGQVSWDLSRDRGLGI